VGKFNPRIQDIGITSKYNFIRSVEGVFPCKATSPMQEEQHSHQHQVDALDEIVNLIGVDVAAFVGWRRPNSHSVCTTKIETPQ